MSYARQLLDTYPASASADADVLAIAIDALSDCAQACTADVDADLSEQDLAEMVRCIRLCLDCADACDATRNIVIRQTEPDLGVLRAEIDACAVACRACAEECDKHAAHHEHCRICAEVCRRCERACRDLLGAIRD